MYCIYARLNENTANNLHFKAENKAARVNKIHEQFNAHPGGLFHTLLNCIMHYHSWHILSIPNRNFCTNLNS